MSKKNITEIKKGEIGHGLLIEHDGYISINDTNNQPILENIKHLRESKGGEFYCPYPFIVNAVFQKYGVENANGRIYPEAILKREVEKYQKLIKERMAIGECYRPEAKILTVSGWKYLYEVIEGEEIITLNTETNKIENKPILRIVKYNHKGKMIHMVGSHIDDLVTPEHGFPIYEFNMGLRFLGFYSATDLMNADDKNIFIPFDSNLNPQYIKNITFTEEDYDGEVMCVEVENHTWYVMDNEKSHWTKNCNHPSEATIDLSRVAMNIIEQHWEGKTLVGQLEILTTEGFRKHGIVSTCGDEVANLVINGIKIGVSSRGLGSVEKKLGSLIVGDDFELVCWDVVSSPSTPGAYIDENPKNLEQYKENKESNRTKSSLFESLKSFDNWLNS